MIAGPFAATVMSSYGSAIVVSTPSLVFSSSTNSQVGIDLRSDTPLTSLYYLNFL